MSAIENQINNSKNMSKNIEHLTEEEILARALIIKKAHGEHELHLKEISSTTERIPSEIDQIIKKIPKKELQDAVRDITINLERGVEKGAYDHEKMIEMVDQIVKKTMLAYMDNRQYLKMFNRAYIEYRLTENIEKIIDKNPPQIEDLHKIARINFDLNGLKALNDIGGHSNGNMGLELFSTILKDGDTVKKLQSMHIEVIASAEGGDEFGMTLYGDTDLRPLLETIKEDFLNEISTANATELLTPEQIRSKGHEVSNEFKFVLGSSFGIATFGEALESADVTQTQDYEKMVRIVLNQMFNIADTRANENKELGKNNLETTNPELLGLYNIRDKKSQAVIDKLEKQILELQRELALLKAQKSV